MVRDSVEPVISLGVLSVLGTKQTGAAKLTTPVAGRGQGGTAVLYTPLTPSYHTNTNNNNTTTIIIPISPLSLLTASDETNIRPGLLGPAKIS